MSRTREEAMAAGIAVRSIQHSMKRRQMFHDYHLKGTYMLTLVVADRKPLFGRLVTHVETPTPASGSSFSKVSAEVELSPLGRAIRDEEIRKISALYPMVEVWKLCIMPDHIHLIVRVREDMPQGKHLGYIVRGFKAGCSQAWWRIAGLPAKAKAQGGPAPAAGAQAGPAPAAGAQGGPTSAVQATPCVETQGRRPSLPADSSAGVGRPPSAPPSSSRRPSGPSLFETGYNDRILQREGQLANWKRYLADNPRRLAVKRMHPELFTTQQHIDLADWHCQAVGNHFLLDIPQKVAVIVHRAYTDAEYAAYREEWLACGEAGGVLVSAAIAPREKEVMREAMDRGYRIILVRENGFPPLYKPSGESFDACSEGLLLQISPWQHHNARRVVSREQCLMLNRLVDYITQET